MNNKLNNLKFKFETEIFEYPKGNSQNLALIQELYDNDFQSEDIILGFALEGIAKVLKQNLEDLRNQESPLTLFD